MSLKQEEYKAVLISFQLSAKANKYLSEATERSGRTKKQEARLRLHDHLEKYHCISELHKTEIK